MANRNLRYVRGLTVPKTIGTGRKLMHNNVRHTVNMPTGVNGFRAWTDREQLFFAKIISTVRDDANRHRPGVMTMAADRWMRSNVKGRTATHSMQWKHS